MAMGPGWTEGEWEVDAERDLPKLDGVELMFGCSENQRKRAVKVLRLMG